MNDVNSTLEAIQRIESQGEAMAGGQRVRKVGPYGMLPERFRALADDMGYTGARADDPEAQRIVAREKLERDYRELGDWQAAAISFRFGRAMARKAVKDGLSSPSDLRLAGHKDVAAYVASLQEGTPYAGRVAGRPSGSKKQAASPVRKRSEDILRAHVVGMRNSQRKRLSESLSTQEVPDGAE